MASISNEVPPPPENSRNWVELPAELTSSILVRLGAVEVLMSARKVCKTWRLICSDPHMWRVVEIRYSDYERSPRILKHVLKKAVDLSSGQLIQLHLEIPGSPDNLLRYVFERSSQLRRLYLLSTSTRMSEMLKRLLLLEELHLEGPFNLKKAIEIAGRCCPQLKSLELVNFFYLCPRMGCDEDALAIAEHMPGLQHLQLYGPNKITSDGLLTIFENCPDLESLHVWLNVANVGPELVRRLSQQIKNLRLSYDSREANSPALQLLNSMSLLTGIDPPCELYDIDIDEVDDLDSSDEDDSSALSDTSNASDDYDDSEVAGGSDRDSD